MATFAKLGSGNWRVQVRQEALRFRDLPPTKDAEEWALDIERRIDIGQELTALKRHLLSSFSEFSLDDIASAHEAVERSNAIGQVVVDVQAS